MAYGTNAPFGLKVKTSLLGDPTNINSILGKIGITAWIAPGYAQNIGVGDPIIAANGANGGTIASAADVQYPAVANQSTAGWNYVGTFAGILTTRSQSVVGTASGQIIPGGNLSAYVASDWRNSTEPVPCMFIPTTAEIVYTAQVGGAGSPSNKANLGAVWNYAKFTFTLVNNLVVLNGNQSTGYLSLETENGSPYAPANDGAGYSSFQIIGFDDSMALGTQAINKSQIGLNYGNVLVRYGSTAFSKVTTTGATYLP